MTENRKRGQDGERDINVNRGVFALGVCVVPARLVPTMRTSLDEMHGADWVPLPYSFARSLHDTLNIYVRQKLPYLAAGGHSLIILDHNAGTLDMSELGKMALKKLQQNIATR
jgi:hypothetical protein